MNVLEDILDLTNFFNSYLSEQTFLITPYNPYYLVGFFFIKFLFRTDMLAQHRLLKIVKGEKNLNVCQKSVKF